jgi:hypothetical protein
MKKLVFTFVLFAAVATCFMSCEKTVIESDTHTQQFTFDTEVFDIENAFTVENIQDSGLIYNDIVLWNSEEWNPATTFSHGVVIVFQGDITPGTYNLTFDPQHPTAHFPMLLVVDERGADFTIQTLLNQHNVHAAYWGSFTLAINQDQFTITTSNVHTKRLNELDYRRDLSVDFEDNMLRYVLSTVQEGTFNDTTNVVTAGRTKLKIFDTMYDVAAFITENGDLFGLISSTSFDDGIPEGEYWNNENSFIYIQGMNYRTLTLARRGEAFVERDGDIYTIDMTDLRFQDGDGINVSGSLHYVGTMPQFDIPFLANSNQSNQ